jgi:hypothetical protein
MVNLSWTEVALSERETRVGSNDPIQSQAAVVQNQGLKRSFRHWRLAVVVVLIIAAIGGFDLHWTTLQASYYGRVGTDTCAATQYAMGWTGTISLDQVVEDHIHGTFTGFISASDGCDLSLNGAIQGSVTPIGNVSFTYGSYVHFSGTIQFNGGIEGQYYYHGTVWAGNFCLNACPNV